MIYLDHNATTPLDREVQEAIRTSFALFGNPSSTHRLGLEAKAAIEQARERVARLIGANPSEIVFTSGGTESNNLAIIGTAYVHQRGHLITSAIEHPSVMNPMKWLELRGYAVTYLPVGRDGRIDPDDVKKALQKDTILISIMHSNNETGVLQPVQEVGMIARERGIAFHTDAAQSVGKMHVNVQNTAADMLTIVSHKFYGPKGIGALYVRSGVQLTPILFGAGHERGMRPGTENIIGIAGLGEACAIALRDMDFRIDHALRLRERLYELLRNDLDCALNGHRDYRLPNTLNISLKGISAEYLIAQLRDAIAMSAGSACHAGTRRPSAVLKAMGVSDDAALSSLRLSVGKDNTLEEIKTAASMITRTARRS
ncbi:MAG: cysteine desulfurase family protein [Nitrospirota bacterium]